VLRVSKVLIAATVKGWISPSGSFVPVEDEHASQSRALLGEDWDPDYEQDAFTELLQRGWVRIGATLNQTYIMMGKVSQRDLHAIQTFVMNHPEFKRSRVSFEQYFVEKGRNLSYYGSMEDFLATNSVGDLWRHSLTTKTAGIDVKLIKKFKTNEGIFSIWDIDATHRRPDMFTVHESPEGWVVRNVLIPEELRRSGVATTVYEKLNSLSMQKTGNPLRSTQARTLLNGEAVLELSDQGRSLWESFVSKGLANPRGDEFSFKKAGKTPQELETEAIRESKKSPAAKKRHKFKPAKWTHGNGHPRCLICGDEETLDGFCEGV